MMQNTYNTLAGFHQWCEDARIRHGLHLIGCEFYTGNKEVDGWVISTDSTTSPTYIRGNKGYCHRLGEIYLYKDDSTLVPYGDYMECHYPDFYHVWKWQIYKEDRIKYEHLTKPKET